MTMSLTWFRSSLGKALPWWLLCQGRDLDWFKDDAQSPFPVHRATPTRWYNVTKGTFYNPYQLASPLPPKRLSKPRNILQSLLAGKSTPTKTSLKTRRVNLKKKKCFNKMEQFYLDTQRHGRSPYWSSLFSCPQIPELVPRLPHSVWNLHVEKPSHQGTHSLLKPLLSWLESNSLNHSLVKRML